MPNGSVTHIGVAFKTTWRDVTPSSSLLRAHAPDHPPPQVSSLPVNPGSLQVTCPFLLDDGPSRPYLCNPGVGAWTHTPPSPWGASTHFFPQGIGLTLPSLGSADETAPAMQLPQGGYFRGGSHSLRFRLLHSLDPQDAPTVAPQSAPGRRAVYTTHLLSGCPNRLWHRFVPDLGNWHGWTLTSWVTALSAAPEG